LKYGLKIALVLSVPLLESALLYFLQDYSIRVLTDLQPVKTYWLIAVIGSLLVLSFVGLIYYFYQTKKLNNQIIQFSKSKKRELQKLKNQNTELLSDLHLLNPNYIEDKEFGDAFDEAVSKP
jgi:predicted PurR-regulated permease PerM